MENIKKQTIKVEGEKWQSAINYALEKALKRAELPGFRKGHVPKDVFLKKYGKEALYDDAINECLNEQYYEIVKDLKVIDQPRVDIKSLDDNGFEAEITLTLYPTVELGEYKNLDVKRPDTKVSKKEIDETIENMKKRFAENVIKEGEVVNGDVAIINFEGFKDGVAFEGGKGENYSLTIGSNTFIPGFEEQIIGMKKGEEKDINVTFPEDYHEESLKGQPVVFKVKVNEIKEVVLPELDKDFFEDLGMDGVDSKETLEATVKENIKAQKEAEAENKYTDELLEAIAKNTKVDVPEVMTHEEAHYMVHQFEDKLRMQGMTLEDFLKYTNSKEEDLVDQMRPDAEKRIKYRLILEEIAKVENIEVTEEELNKEIDEACADYQMSREDFLGKVADEKLIKEDIRLRKALEIIKK